MRSGALSSLRRAKWALLALVFGAVQLAPLFYFAGTASAATNTVTKSGSTFSDVAFSGSDYAWSVPGNAATSDDAWATVQITNSDKKSNYLKATDFGFIIPNDATINSIAVNIERSEASNSSATIRDKEVKLVKNDVAGGDNKKSNADWPSTDSVASYGSDLWGTTWLPSDINSNKFGTVLSVGKNGSGSETARVDYISIAVTYTEAVPQPDLTVTKTNNVSSNATINEAFTWTIRVENTGSATATFDNGEEVLRDDRPSNTPYGVPSVSYNGTTGTVVCAEDSPNNGINRRITCSASGTVTFAPGAYIDISFTATPASIGTLSNPRSGGSNYCRVDRGDNVPNESNESNNNCSDTVTVSEAPPVVNPSLDESCGMDIVLVLDSSDSMTDDDIQDVKDAATTLVDTLMPGTPTQIGVIDFDTNVISSLSPTATRTDVINAINSITHADATEYTNWDEALQTADAMVGLGGLVVIITDGNPTTSNGSLSDLEDAVVRANAIKTGGTRMLAIGIDSRGSSSSGLDLPNLEAITGPNDVTIPPGPISDINNVDIILGDVTQLGTVLSELVTSLCGGTITVQKLIDGDGDLQTTSDQIPASDWEFTVNGTTGSPITDLTEASGYTNPFSVSADTYSVTETIDQDYDLIYASCSGAMDDGTFLGSSVTGIVVGDTDVVSCVFINSEPQKVDICHATASQSHPYEINSPAASGDVDGHDNHNGSIWFPGITVGWGDIIPPFDYDGGHYNGKNWSTFGQTISRNGCTIPTGTIIIDKVTDPTADPTSFGFHLDSSEVNVHLAFSLTDTTSPFNQVLPTGVYAVTEDSLPTGWQSGGVSCTSNQQPGNIGTNFDLDLGEVVTCAFTNTAIQPQLTVTKVVINDNGGVKTVSDFPLYVGSTAVTSGVKNGFDVGTYTIWETTDPGYTSVISGNCAADGSITLALGDDKSCTITNNDNTPALTLIKQLGETYGSTIPATAWTLSAAGNLDPSTDLFGETGSPGATSGASFKADTYTLGEFGPTGFTASWGCVGGNALIGQAIAIALGQNVTCTLTNTAIQPQLTVNKVVINDDGGSKTVSDFSLYVGSTAVTSGVKNGFNVGTYTVWETTDPGYTSVISGNCAADGSITLALADDKSCTITNNDIAPTLRINKFITPPDYSTTESFTYNVVNNLVDVSTDLTDDTANGPSGVYKSYIATINAGTLDVTENLPSEWSLGYVQCKVNDENVYPDTAGLYLINVGDDVECNFTNEPYGRVEVLKYQDYDEDGERDTNYFGQGEEPALSGMLFALSSYAPATYNGETDELGQIVFNVPADTYYLSELLAENSDWRQTSVSCDNQLERLEAAGEVTNGISGYELYAAAGQTVHCTVGNAYKPELLLTKSNNAISAKRVGDTVTYTLTLTNPYESSLLGMPVITDTPPEGFEYITGSWTASSNFRGDLKALGISAQPTYNSPGIWQFNLLGEENLIYPGEVLTLTYKTKIDSLVTPGTYPDLAFAVALSSRERPVFDNVQLANSIDNPFVGTKVAVIEGPKSSTYKLVETGASSVIGALVGSIMVAGALILYALPKVRKGNK
jgi:uncharacterized repeat protein (TIGR01451 family)